MKKIILLIFLIGFSAGLILSSSINIVNSRLVAKTKQIEKNEKNKEKLENKEQINKTKDLEKLPIKSQNKPIPNEYVIIRIESGYTSETVANVLYDNQLISDKESFNTLIKSLNMSSKIKVGEKTIKKGSSMEEIINIITS